MSYTTPPTFSSGAVLTAAQVQILADDIAYLNGLASGTTFSATRLTRSAATSLSDATWTAVSWTSEVFDYGGWYSSGTNMVVPAGAVPSGFTTLALLAVFNASFVANATGYRGIRILKNGSSEVAQTIPGFASDTSI